MSTAKDKIKVLVGMATCGQAAGGVKVYPEVERQLKELGIDADLNAVGCIGCCSLEPLMDIVMPGRTRVTYKQVDAEKAGKILQKHIKEGEIDKKAVLAQMHTNGRDETPYEGVPFFDEIPFFAKQRKIVLKRCGYIDPKSFDDYIAMDGYKAVTKVLKEMTQQQVIDEVTKSGLRGRGGAGFPTGMKWSFASKSPGPQKYFICNADEGDPGAFMDRSVLEGDPHAVLEGMIIGGYAIGANTGYIYCRAEYPLAIEQLLVAIEDANKHGYLGKNILGSGFDYQLIIKEGAGAFVCGEETALMASIEGFRGMPRSRPPFPAIKGLFGKPTNINNVETLANIGHIILMGGDKYAEIGTEKTKGTKVFAVTGKIKNPGLIEVPAGIQLREVLIDICGGSDRKNVQIKATQLGGPSGGCIPFEHAETAIDYESLVQAGAIMGSGGVVVMDEMNCMVDVARYFLNFTAEESCGKCTPCRVGTKVMLDILERICRGEGEMEDIQKLEDLGNDIKAASLCALGQTAPNPVLSTIRYYRHEYEQHIKDKFCAATVCVPLIKFEVREDICTKCGLCKKPCPTDALVWEKKQTARINHATCTKCRACIEACPFRAIK